MFHVRRLLFSAALCLLLASGAPAADPLFEFVTIKGEGDKPVNLAKTSDGALTFVLAGRRGDIVDVKSKKTVHTLDAGVMWAENSPRAFSCWTFTADGRYLITGSAFKEISASVDRIETNSGELRVWEVKTGKLVQKRGGRIGSIRSVEISEDGVKVVFSAARYSIDGA